MIFFSVTLLYNIIKFHPKSNTKDTIIRHDKEERNLKLN